MKIFVTQPVNESWEQLGLVGAKLAVGKDQALQADGELDVAGPDHVLDFEVLEFGGKAELLNNAGVLSGGQAGVFL